MTYPPAGSYSMSIHEDAEDDLEALYAVDEEAAASIDVFLELTPTKLSESPPKLVRRITTGDPTTTSDGTVVVIEATVVHPPQPTGFRSIEDRLAEMERNPKRAEALDKARRRLAKTLQPDAPLAALRMSRGLSQRELAGRLGTSQSRLSRIEAGLDDPRLSTVRKLADALAVDVNAIDEAIAARREKQS